MNSGVGSPAKLILDDYSWSKSQNFYMLKPEPEIWVQVTQPKLWGKRVNLSRNKRVFRMCT